MMRQMTTVLVAVTLSGCEDLAPIACTLDFRFGINPTVRDVSSRAPIAEGATMTLRDGFYFESVTGTDDEQTLSGAGERGGRYTVSVSKSGYHTWVQTDVFVDEDQCHVHPVTLVAELTAR